jgi:hypothetical protein
MIAPLQQRPTGRLLGPDGRPLAQAIEPSTGWGRPSAPWEPERNAPLSHRRGDDERVYRWQDRLQTIHYLRWAALTNPVLCAVLTRYGTAIGSPQIRSTTGSPAYDDARTLYLERRLASCGLRGESMSQLQFLISVEEAICGEVFAVFATTGGVQLVPAELCGSPAVPPPNERQGIQFSGTGRPTAYRFGVRLASGGISYETVDGARLVSAEYVHHLGRFSRVEQIRPTPPLAGILPYLDRLQRIVEARTVAIQNQAAFSLFVTKNMDPALAASLLSDGTEETRQEIGEAVLARSTAYTELRSGTIMFGEQGEDIRPISPQMEAGELSEFIELILRHVCAPLGIPPEECLLGYGDSTYSSARADKLGWRQTLDDIRRRREGLLDRWQRWQVRRGNLLGEIDLPPDGMIDEVAYSWPALPAVDEARAAASEVALHAAGLRSRSTQIGAAGLYAEQEDREIVREAARLARLIRQESDPALAGTPLDQIPVTAEEIAARMPGAVGAAQALAALSQIASSPTT